ncbi:delta-aminolevulinic acid dehydratase [Streptomyces violaceus]|uniref:Delta-aminolevulinic acid dehydratase n=1 Tax=Streptomyces violaceus TaxID=1936 RepID=A0ABZ1NW20_STRVL
MYEEFQVNPGKPEQFIDTALQVVGDGADMLLLGPAMFSADGLTELKKRTLARLFPFSVSGEYTTLSHMDTATGKRDVRRLVELFTMLMRGGAEASITYAELDIARYLND